MSSDPSTQGLDPRAAALPDMRLRPGEQVAGRYQIDAFLGRGGMGEVYAAHDAALQDPVALKTVRPHIAADPGVIERFKREILLARKVTHPNVCRIFDLGVHEDARGPLWFLTMELLRGETLAARIARQGRFRPDDARPLAVQLANGLAAAHRAGIVHRDFKSGNVMLVPDGAGTRAVITDFGLARSATSVPGESSSGGVSQTGAMLGTPAYMAPEQVQGGAVDARTDIYALGIVLYEMVTGETPFHGDSPLATAVQRLSADPVPPRLRVPDLDARWEAVILRCLERDPARRFADAAHVAEALQGTRAVGGPRDRRLAWMAAALLVAGAGAAWMWQRRAAVDEEALRPSGPRRALAVLGFRNLSGKAEVAWISTALSEMLVTELSASPGLRSIPGESVARMKTELALADADTFGRETLQKIRDNVGADLVVMGSYVATGASGPLRLDLRVQDARAGETLVAVAQTGTVQELLDVVARAGSEVRARLGVSPLTAGATGALAAARPESAEAARLYAEGLDRLRVFDALAARERLQAAVAQDPSWPLAHAALAQALSTLGYDKDAAAEANRAVELGGSLGREDRLYVEARAHELGRRWPRAIEAYRALAGFFPDNPDYALRLAAVLTAAGQGKDALATLDRLRATTTDPGTLLRADVAEAEAAESTADFKREDAAATRAIDRARAQGARLVLARALLSRAWARRNLGNAAGAFADAREAASIYEATGDRAGVARAVNSEGTVLYVTGKYDDALARYETARAAFRAIGDERGEANSLNNMAVVRRDQGRFPEALALYDASLALAERNGDARGLARTLNNKGLIRWQTGDLAGARKMFEESAPAFRAAGDRSGEALAINNLGAVLYTAGELAEAKRRYEQALPQLREIGNRHGEALSLVTLGAIQRTLGDLAAARATLEDGRKVSEELGNKTNAGYAHFQLGQVTLDAGEVAVAKQHFERARVLFKEVGEASEPVAVVGVALCEAEDGRVAEAEKQIRAVYAAVRRTPREDFQAAALEALARVMADAGRHDAARAELRTLRGLKATADDPSVRFAADILGARLDLAAGRPAAAAGAAEKVVAEARAKGFAGVELEARLVKAQATGDAAELARVAQDARERGFGLLARRAESAGKR